VISENLPLAPLTTLGAGGPARYFLEAASEEQVRQGVDWAASRQLPLFVLGGGSNVLIADAGWPGLVLRIALRGVTQSGEVFEAAAGEDWDALVARAVAGGYAGIECLSGIPGSVGGTPVQNVGAYGQEVSETITEVRALDRTSGGVVTLGNAGCGFRYRQSIFNSGERGRYIVLRVTYCLRPGGEPRIEYADLKAHFAGRRPILAETREAVRAIRHRKAMLIVEGDEDCRSAGSFFKNPVVPESAICNLQSAMPHWTAGPGQVKLAAAWLVENAGFPKGWRRGAVGISSKHSLALVNRGGATAAEILALAREIQERVAEQFGVRLEMEPVLVGF
jgi:UDP-N-acetylmuramate dehydrogenase